MSVSNPYEATHEVSSDPFQVGNKSYGGIGRGIYFFGGLGISIVQNVITAGLAAAGEGAAMAILPVVLLTLAGTVALACYRMINLGSSGWWGLGIVVPLLNIFVGLRCLICPAGYADHKTLDRTGKIISGILIALLVLMVIFVVFVVLRSQP